MSLLKIARMGHPVLRRAADKVPDPKAPEVQRLIRDMIETMFDASGVGLAAPQVYESRRIIVFHVPAARMAESSSEDSPSMRAEDTQKAVPLTVLCNPGFEPLDPRQDEGWEGCLSIPGLVGSVPRYRRISYWGLSQDGETICREASGFHARVVQHEIDHLDGILYPERMTDLSTLAFTDQTGSKSSAS